MLAMFGIGVIEMMIVLGILGGGGAFVVGLVVLLATKRPSASWTNNPNLRPCPDCNQFISVRAAACPHCGGPVKGG
jgi:hypothetical protein